MGCKFSLPYITFATNNLNDVINDKDGARCVYCLGKPKIDINTLTCDKTTVICPICGVAAVVPISKIPEPKEETLKFWNFKGFKDISSEIEIIGLYKYGPNMSTNEILKKIYY